MIYQDIRLSCIDLLVCLVRLGGCDVDDISLGHCLSRARVCCASAGSV